MNEKMIKITIPNTKEEDAKIEFQGTTYLSELPALTLLLETIAERNKKHPQDILELVTCAINHFHPTENMRLTIEWQDDRVKIQGDNLEEYDEILLLNLGIRAVADRLKKPVKQLFEILQDGDKVIDKCIDETETKNQTPPSPVDDLLNTLKDSGAKFEIIDLNDKTPEEITKEP